MVDFIVRLMRRRGYEPVIAHYEPYSRSPRLSVPVFALMRRMPGLQIRREYGCEAHAIGAWLPELEFTHYAATQHWKSLIESCSAYLSVSGNVLAATPYYQTGKPFLSWVAAGWHDDRKNRVAEYPAVRKLIDRAIVAPNVKKLERSILRSGKIMALSQYTKRTLEEIAGEPIVSAVLPMPVDAAFWTPRPESRVGGRVGFCGRLSDPRKNIDLLLAAVARASVSMTEISAVLIGGEADSRVQARLVAARNRRPGEVHSLCHGCRAARSTALARPVRASVAPGGVVHRRARGNGVRMPGGLYPVWRAGGVRHRWRDGNSRRLRSRGNGRGDA